MTGWFGAGRKLAGPSKRAASLALVAPIMAVVLALPANAQSVPADAQGRYQMKPTDDGFVRLDTQTGAVSLCARQNGDWACRGMADDQKALQDRIAKLEEDNRALKDENRRLEDVMGLNPDKAPGTVPEGPGGPSNRFALPTEKDVDKAFDYFEGLLKRFRERLKKLEEPKKNEGVPL
ncbi:MAG: hypothetical protein AB7E80_14070 [Hyphomicrobiaceae bacterium]